MYNTKNKTQSAYRKNKPTLNLIPKNCVCVFPIELVGGKTQVSNLGIMPNRRYYDKGSFLYWQEVFDGRSALKLQWEDSITLEKPKRPEGVETGYNYYLAKPSVGRYYYGKPISSGSEALEISEDASFEEFMSMKASQNITLRFEYEPTDRTSSKWELQKFFRFDLVDNDIYNLYLIPEICEEKLMYISEHNEYYDDETGLTKGCEITFATLGDKIQKSGKAIEQYCSWNAPGEFAVRPEIIEYYDEEAEKWEKQVIINPIALYYPTPIKYLQVEQQGPALTSTIYALGRRQEWDETEQCWKIGPSKILLPCDFITTQPNPLNRTSTPSKNFFCFPDEQVTMVTTADFLKWTFDSATQPLEQLKNAGMISIGKDWTDIDHKSNLIPSTEGAAKIRKDYFDKSWFPLAYEGATLGPHDTTGCVYTGPEISFTASDTMIDIMCKNAFIFNQQPIIPLSFYSTRPYYLRDIPLIGAIANFFKVGDIKLNSHTTSRQCSNLCFFGDADVMTMCANLNGSFGTSFRTGYKVFPINFFGTNENMYQKLGVNSTNTTFCVALTDQIQLNNQVWDTIYLGQSKKEDGTYIFPETQQSLLVDSSLKPITPVTSNFIIDAVVVQSIFDGKIRLSCYGAEEQDFIYPQWTATILSNANWENGNMRDWTNIFLLSNWEERFCVQEDEFVWPMPPHKKDTSSYELITNINEDFNFTWNSKYYDRPTVGDRPNVWKDSQHDWLSLAGQGNMAKSQISKLLYEQNLSYTDLDCADKAEFFNKYENISFTLDNSLASVGNLSKTVLGSKYIIQLVSEKDVYEIIPELVSIRSSGQYELKLSGSGEEFHIRPFIAQYRQPSLAKGTFIQKVKVAITLGGTSINVKVYDNSFISLTDTEYNVSHYYNNQNFFSAIVNSINQTLPESFRYLTKLDKILFVKKDL